MAKHAMTTERTGETTPAPASGPAVPPKPRASDANWSGPVDRLAVGTVPAKALNLNVEGRRLVGPVQGFGQLWQKRYRIRLDGAAETPEEVIATWKGEFGSFWPKGNSFYGPITGIAPGEVAVLNLSVPGNQTLSTGVMVIYADEESFTFMTPEGHMFASWITFSSFRDGETPVVQIEVLLRANDPMYEVSMALFGHKQENAFWLGTLHRLAARFGVEAEATMEQTCVDRKRQWRNAKNIRYNAAIRSATWTATHPRHWFRGSGEA
jgi:hypothetical protein